MQASVARMVKKTKAQHQSEYLEFAEDLFQYAVALDNNDDDDILFDDELGFRFGLG